MSFTIIQYHQKTYILNKRIFLMKKSLLALLFFAGALFGRVCAEEKIMKNFNLDNWNYENVVFEGKNLNLESLAFSQQEINMQPSSMKYLAFFGSAFAIRDAHEHGTWKIPYAFEHPLDGKFKIIPKENDKFDETSMQHFGGSALLGASLNFYFDEKKIKSPTVKSILLSIGLGLTKEVLDGYREGFSEKDFYLDAAGTLVGIGIYQGAKVLF